METRIYYFGLSDDLIETLKSTELSDALATKKLEITVHTSKTAFITANKAYKDKYTQLFLINEDTKNFFMDKGKVNWVEGAFTHIINSAAELEGVLNEVYALAPEPEVTTEAQDEQGTQEASEQTLEDNVELDPFGNPVIKETTQAQQQTPHSSTYLEEDEVKVFKHDFKQPRIKRAQTEVEKRFKLHVYKDTGSRGIEEDLDVGSFENTQARVIKDLAEHKFLLTEAEAELNRLKTQYAGYTSPNQTQVLLTQITQLSDSKDAIEKELADLRITGNPTLLSELADLKTQHAELVERYKTLELNFTNIKIERDGLEGKVSSLTQEVEEKTAEVTRYENTFNAASSNTKDILLTENIKLANNNRKLQVETDKLIKEKASLQVQLESLLIKLQTSTGNVPIVQGNLPNVELWFSLSDRGNELFYERVLTDTQFTSDKQLVIDLGTNSYLSSFIKLTSITNPYKWLTEGLPIEGSYAGTQAMSANLITSMAHPQPRWLYTNKVDWQTKLEELNKQRTLLYLGVLTNTEVYNFMRMIQANEVQIPMYGLLGDTTQSFNIDKMNLSGLNLRTLKLVGSRGLQYSQLPIALNYKRGGEVNE